MALLCVTDEQCDHNSYMIITKASLYVSVCVYMCVVFFVRRMDTNTQAGLMDGLYARGRGAGGDRE